MFSREETAIETQVLPTVLVTGASGFIASGIIEALLASGYRVLACTRSGRNLPESPQLSHRKTDLRQFTTAGDWAPLLEGVGVVINCAGILRETRPGDFDLIHHRAPRVLAEACLSQGVGHYIQISALGSEADGPFITSKHALDEWLLAGELPATVIRPSVVISTRGSYGGTSMLRALAALPGVLLLPGQGEQRIQPVLLEDLADLILRCMAKPPTGSRLLHAVGPAPITLRRYLLDTRAWLKFPPPRIIEVPLSLVHLGAWLGEKFGEGPLGTTITGMLERGNVAPPDSPGREGELLGWEPRDLSRVLSHSASFSQDRWQARLYLLAPLVWLALVLLWLGSALAGLLAGPADWRPVLDPLGVPAGLQYPLVLATSLMDLLLGVALLLRRWVRGVLWLMLAAVAAYTLGIGLLVPGLWLEPLGGLLKNLPILALTGVALVLEDRR